MGPTAQAEAILVQLQGLASDANRAGMARYGINVERALGISMGLFDSTARGGTPEARGARWVARDARRALQAESTRARLARRGRP